jgi:hypothetical protein
VLLPLIEAYRATILDDPAFTPTTIPFEPTVATAALSELQDGWRPHRTRPNLSRMVALACVLSLTLICDTPSTTVIDAAILAAETFTLSGGTVGLTPPSVTPAGMPESGEDAGSAHVIATAKPSAAATPRYACRVTRDSIAYILVLR